MPALQVETPPAGLVPEEPAPDRGSLLSRRIPSFEDDFTAARGSGNGEVSGIGMSEEHESAFIISPSTRPNGTVRRLGLGNTRPTLDRRLSGGM